MNKNDLRYIKTERLIVHTYVDLRLRDPSPVKVSDLCREALINKTTFYSHYDTMESLRRHICRETVADILGRCDCARMAFSDTYAFVSELVGAISREERLIRALYGDDVTSLLNDAEGLFSGYICMTTTSRSAKKNNLLHRRNIKIIAHEPGRARHPRGVRAYTHRL